MNDHNRLLILGGLVVVLAPFVLIGIGIASDYRAAHPNRPHEPHHARNIVLGFAVVIMASVVFARLSHHPQAPTLAPVRADSATGVPFVPVPTSVVAAPRAASPGASAATSPRSTTTTLAVPGSGLMTAFLSALVKGTTVTTAPKVPPGTVVVTTTKPPTSTATTKSTVATTTTTRRVTTTTRTTLPRSTTTTRPLPTTTTVATTTTTVPATTTTVPATTTTTATTVPVTTTTGAP